MEGGGGRLEEPLKRYLFRSVQCTVQTVYSITTGYLPSGYDSNKLEMLLTSSYFVILAVGGRGEESGKNIGLLRAKIL